MTVNGRDEEDVDPDTILKKVAKASGANFNFHQQNQAYRDTPSGPVVSRYLKPQRHFHCFRHLSTLGLTHDQPGKKKETRFIDQTDLYCAFRGARAYIIRVGCRECTFARKRPCGEPRGMCKLLIADGVVKPVCLFVPACQHPLSHGAGFRVSQSQRRGGNSTHQQG